MAWQPVYQCLSCSVSADLVPESLFALDCIRKVYSVLAMPPDDLMGILVLAAPLFLCCCFVSSGSGDSWLILRILSWETSWSWEEAVLGLLASAPPNFLTLAAALSTAGHALPGGRGLPPAERPPPSQQTGQRQQALHAVCHQR